MSQVTDSMEQSLTEKLIPHIHAFLIFDDTNTIFYEKKMVPISR